MSAKSYQYAIIRVVPRVDQEEFVNAGAIVYSPENRYLGAKIQLGEERLKALWPKVDVASVRRHLRSIETVCEGAAEAGPVGAMSQSERFHWLTSPRSAMIQISPVRTGLSAEPAKTLERLVEAMVG